MKLKFAFYLFLILCLEISVAQNSWIRINQVGYKQNSLKIAVLGSKNDISLNNFQLIDALTEDVVFTSQKISEYPEYACFTKIYRLDFSRFNVEGTYYIKANDIISPNLIISRNPYKGAADFILKYMRQQRCGYNPFLKDSCHTQDGFIVDHSTLDSTHIDVTGGWHDASDYLQYLATSANATFQMLFAYQQNPYAYKDRFDKDGNPGSNGIPDILDEAKWGLDWLNKMNPEYGFMFNQIADDRDHRKFT
ncbi:MAG: glycoside hydrolase family 9 protein, partial [Melioribacteraceae bacterium]|nr:glycoside hydrolase family 9 protein [Melioribacteraceae bacterium]